MNPFHFSPAAHAGSMALRGFASLRALSALCSGGVA